MYIVLDIICKTLSALYNISSAWQPLWSDSLLSSYHNTPEVAGSTKLNCDGMKQTVQSFLSSRHCCKDHFCQARTVLWWKSRKTGDFNLYTDQLCSKCWNVLVAFQVFCMVFCMSNATTAMLFVVLYVPSLFTQCSDEGIPGFGFFFFLKKTLPVSSCNYLHTCLNKAQKSCCTNT